jgi:Ser/Thr protein kinase RdoA (MazF antagonist)
MIDNATGSAVASAFELGELVTPLTYVDRGVQGEVYRAETRAGTWALKRLFGQPDPRQVELEVRLQEAAYAAGVQSPRARRTVEGRLLAEIRGAHWRANEWVSATPVGPDRLPEVGASLARLHELRLPAPHDVLSWLTTPPSPAAWEQLRSKVDQTGPPWASRFVELYPDLVRLCDLAPTAADADAVLCHCDFGPANLGVADDRVVIFDWGRAGAMSPRQELGYALWAWAEADDPASVVRAILTGYRSHVIDRIDVDLEMFGCAATGWLNFLHACAAAGNDRFVVQLLERPMTLDGLRTLLDYAA